MRNEFGMKQRLYSNILFRVVSVGGTLFTGLLLVRLVLLLFAARPSNPVVAVVLALTNPLVWLFGGLDRWLQQPRFGARLELATLCALVVLGMIVMVAGRQQGETNG